MGDVVSLTEHIRESLRDVLDPEAGVNVVDLGLIRDIRVDDQVAEVRMVLTSDACPFADLLVNSVRRRTEECLSNEAVRAVRVVLCNETNGTAK
jgi:serine O-acetyltransferase